jgi:hypothetical protein
MPFKLASVEGYDSIYPLRNSEWFSIVDWGHTSSMTGRYGIVHLFDSAFLNYANMKYVIDYKKDQWRLINDDGLFYPGIWPPRYQKVFYDRRIYVYENTQSLPYAWMTNQFKVSSDAKEIISTLNESKDPVLMIGEGPGIKMGSDKLDYKIENINKGYNKITFKVITNENSMLFLSESANFGWKAYVDGKETKIIPANFLFQSIPIEKGEHQIEFFYDPLSFKMGLLLTTATFVTLLIFLAKYRKLI